MFLIFTLGRPDVFPHDDLGVRSAMKKAYGLKELPNKVESHRIAEPWRPYATVASWYCWRCLALPPEFFAEFGSADLKSEPACGRYVAKAGPVQVRPESAPTCAAPSLQI